MTRWMNLLEMRMGLGIRPLLPARTLIMLIITYGLRKEQ
jgi:hypothetical protein